MGICPVFALRCTLRGVIPRMAAASEVPMRWRSSSVTRATLPGSADGAGTGDCRTSDNLGPRRVTRLTDAPELRQVPGTGTYGLAGGGRRDAVQGVVR